MSQITTVPPIVNHSMRFVLRSVIHGIVSKTVLLITFKGRKSGRVFTTPVSYSLSGNQVTIFTHANWVENLRNGAPVTLRIQCRYHGVAEIVVDEKQAISTGLEAHLRKVPSDARYYDVTFDDRRNPLVHEVEKAVQTVVMICVRLSNPINGVGV